MRRRLLELCLLAYPRGRLERDRKYLRDLALELAETNGLGRQAISLLRGGLGERLERRRRSGSRPAAWTRLAIGFFALATIAFAASTVGEISTSLGKRVEIERYVCVRGTCAETRELVAARTRAGWDCGARRRTRAGRHEIAWRCTLVRAPAAARAGDRADRSIDRFLRRTLPTGASGSLVASRGGAPVHCHGFGMADRERRIQAGCDTVYDVMSMTKQFTAAAILKLQMLGGLEVSDPIGRYIGPVPEDKREITVQQLLTHTSGLVGALGDDYERLSRRELIAGALGSKLRTPPGEGYHYSNLGYSLLAAIVEKASGMGYEEFLAARLFAPSGMSQTGYILPDWKRRRVAVEYDPRGNAQGRPFEHPWADDGPYWNLRGNGGMLSTARDMARWHRTLEGDAILDEAAKDEMFEPRVLEEPGGDTYYGYGWVIRDTGIGRVAWHNGGNGWSYGELARVLDDGTMTFWVTNRYKDRAGGWSFNELSAKLTRGVIERLG